MNTQNINPLFPNLEILISKQTGMPLIYDTKQEKVLETFRGNCNYRMLTVFDKEGNNRHMTLGRLLLTLTQPLKDYTGMECDHIDRDPLNDRLENLRWVTKSENMQNRKMPEHRHLSRKMLIVFDNGDQVIYDYKMRKDFFISYNSLYKLASFTNGSNYSKKHNCTATWIENYSDVSLF